MDWDGLFEKKDWTSDDERLIHGLPDSDRAYYAQRIRHGVGILIDLSYDKNDDVRLGVAKNINTPLVVLERLATHDKCAVVRTTALATLKELTG